MQELDSVETGFSLMKSGSDRDPGHVPDSVKTAFSLMKSGSDRDPEHALESVKTAFSWTKAVLTVIRITP